ncbi:ATP-binding protein [Pseudonocardia sichuanensis]|uniref:Anti-sigma regulatory factor (Ser/Thr protein kinase) n=1 Tax=Pseudonocardia kunmingensis TaxID=630975 RepID=A0A543DAI8_9PSEU|nr:ATP-binding protein [Pseudonocardia kunmingensis]TQM06298.1 anti-sigma regulatory factor (Ser/Thr protein kinase) [Pseudonocardia kunmingensis]
MSAPARGPEPLRLRLAASSLPERLSGVRAQMAEWGAGLGAAEDLVEDIVLATHEALANVADHAYPDGSGDALLDAACVDGVVRILVRDQGAWRPPASDPGWRGRGLVIINGLADQVDVHRTSTGTSVTMLWRLPDPGAAEQA